MVMVMVMVIVIVIVIVIVRVIVIVTLIVIVILIVHDSNIGLSHASTYGNIFVTCLVGILSYPARSSITRPWLVVCWFM